MRKPLDVDVVDLSSSKKTGEADLLNLPKPEIINKILSSKTNANFLGNGSEAITYKIEGTKYCARIPYESMNIENSEISFDVSEKDKINHVVARLSNGVTIMNIVEGFTLCRAVGSLPQKARNEALLSLPVSAFNGLFKQVCNAKDNGMVFDCTALNVIVNPEKKTITAIDFYEMDPDYPEEVKPLRHMFEGLQTKSGEKKVAGLIILGALQELKAGHEPCLPVSEFGFADFLTKKEKSLCEKSPCELSDLKTVLTDIECLKLRELYIDEPSTIKQALTAKIEEAKELIEEKLLK